MDMTSIHNNKKIIVALDTYDLPNISRMLKILKNEVSIFKIGYQTFTRFGLDLVKRVQDSGYRVFLDLKLHDIPNTVEKAVESAQIHGIYMLTLHASGGTEMISRAAQKASATGSPLLLGVTVLTSMDDAAVKQVGFRQSVPVLVQRLAGIAKDGGADGVVCSPLEIDLIRKTCGSDFLIVTPGIRAASEQGTDDQKRTLTPQEAIEKGADFLVMGRPVLAAKDPRVYLEDIYKWIPIK